MTSQSTPSRFRLRLVAFFAAVLVSIVAYAKPPTQEDVFKSIQENVEGNLDGNLLLGILLGIIGLIVLLAFVTRQKKRVVHPKALNHQGKLLREVLKTVPIKGRELKQLKIVAEHVEGDRPIASPLTLLLCPSLMAKTIQTKRMKIDRRALMSVARKAGLQVSKK